jgi:hypothetical protein
MSINGNAQVGKWDYIHAAKRLLIDMGPTKILLNHAFVEKGVMILRLDGTTDYPWIFANENEIPDLDVSRYLKELLITKLSLRAFTQGGKSYYFSDPHGLGITNNAVIYDETFQKTSDNFTVLSGEKNYDIQNGVIKRQYYTKFIQTDKGPLVIQSAVYSLSVGDLVFFNNLLATGGSYKVLKNKDYKSITVRNGKIEAVKKKLPLIVWFLIGFGIGATITWAVSILINYWVEKNEPSPFIGITPTSTDSATRINLPQPLSNDHLYKQKIVDLLININNRDFNNMSSYFSEIVLEYNNERNVSGIDVAGIIQSHWADELVSGNIYFDQNDFLVRVVGSNYLVETQQREHSSDKSKVPMVYVTNVLYLLNSDQKIIGVKSEVMQKQYDFLLLFGSTTVSDVDAFVANTKLSDFDRMFGFFADPAKTGEYKKALKEAMSIKFGALTSVYNFNAKPIEAPMTLEMFCERLIDGTYTYNETKSVSQSNGQLNFLTISYN